MAAIAPDLPTQFPCWCRAVYSYGPESKKDLGFVEGDLIECLNAGDGSWWMGRLHRDKRMMGLFPSNFVKVLDRSFRPMTRSTSPMPGGPSPDSTPPPQKQKSTFRKPFQAYAAPNPMTKTPEQSPSPSRQNSHLDHFSQIPPRRGSYLESPTSSQNPSRQGSFQGSQNNGYQGRSFVSRSPTKLNNHVTQDQIPSRQNSYLKNDDSALIRQNGHHYDSHISSYQQSSRAPSPQPYLYSRQPSPAPMAQHYSSRGPSPMPQLDTHISRGPSPAPMNGQGESSPPPPPPPHRSAYTQPNRTPSPGICHDGRYPIPARGHSPIPPSPGAHGMTPSPLRDAMEDVLSSLNGMGMGEEFDMAEEERPPLDPWSPEAFEQLRSETQRRNARQMQVVAPMRSQQAQGPSGQDSDIESYVARMEQRLHNMEGQTQSIQANVYFDGNMQPPPVPEKQNRRPNSSYSGQPAPVRQLSHRRSMFVLGKDGLDRTLTTKTSFSNMTQSTNTNSISSAGRSLMSGSSAGAVSATSAGSMSRRRGAWGSIRKAARPMSAFSLRKDENLSSRPTTPSSGMISYHSSHDSNRPASAIGVSWSGEAYKSGDLGGFTQVQPTLKKKRSGFLKKLVSSAKTGAANARNSIHGTQEVPRSPVKNMLPNGVTSISGASVTRSMGMGGGNTSSNGNSSDMDWMAVRRDVNRSNSLSRIERQERMERCQMLDRPVVDAIELLEEAVEGDEGIDGLAISDPVDFNRVNLQMVDKNSRFITSLPLTINAASLAQSYVCRPYRSDVQRFRAIFTWVSEKISWEEDFEGDVDTRRVIQSHRGCAEEVAVLVMEMCQAVGLHSEVIRGWLKPPGELPELGIEPYPNHWWNAVLVDGEWRIMDCSLASPTNPKRSLYSSASNVMAETFYFLTRPMEACYTHIPSDPAHQHLVPSVDPSILLALPCAMAPYFKHGLRLSEYSTALLFLDGLELMHLHLTVPNDVEIYAEVHAKAYARDVDGDFFESGEHSVKRALAQVDWKTGVKRYQIKGNLPGDEGSGILNIYAGKRGLMHSIKDNPHFLALSIPMFHSGENPSFEFLTRHPTPHAQRHDLYVAQPQCKKLAFNNTYVFSVRQHPSSASSPSNSFSNLAQRPSTPSGMISPIPFIARPGSAMSMASSSASGSNPSTSNYGASSNTSVSSSGSGTQDHKPAKLAIQAPGGKILRLSRKVEGGLQDAGGTWETIIKVGEKGVWRGLVLADRSARWCVWGEWDCV